MLFLVGANQAQIALRAPVPWPVASARASPEPASQPPTCAALCRPTARAARRRRVTFLDLVQNSRHFTHVDHRTTTPRPHRLPLLRGRITRLARSWRQRLAADAAVARQLVTGSVASPTGAPCYPDRSRVRLTGAVQPNNKFGSRTVSYNPPCHIGVGFSCDF